MTDPAAPVDPAARKVLLVGANPALQLFDGDGDGDGHVTAYASMWRVDWSVQGRGTAVVLWHEGRVRTVGDDAALAAWLAERFVRHFPEVDGLPWPEPEHTDHPVTVDIDLATGARVDAGPVRIEMSDVLDRREFTTDEFLLGAVPHSLRLVVAPCATATITLDGHPLAGTIRHTPTPPRPTSSALLTESEVWQA
jgi:hypothetical protein